MLARAATDARLQAIAPTEFACWDDTGAMRQAIDRGTVDLCIVPTNLAAKFYLEERPYRLLGVHMWGILHVVGRRQGRAGWGGLAGARLAIPLPGNMPDTIFHVLLARGTIPVPQLSVRYVDSYAAAASALGTGEVDAAVLPEPQASAAIRQGAIRLLDLQTEWGRIIGGRARFPQAATLLHRRWLGRARDFSAAADDALAFLRESPAAAANVGAGLLAVDAAVVEAAIRATTWSALSGREARPEIEAFLDVLAGVSPDLFRGPLPDQAFYLGDA
ncbi:MAG: hypothetical protein EXQ85_03485 [Alphaproteobacteria bacterium]|nr:hypothetical protein [Alphaproteobacteria bacterium]